MENPGYIPEDDDSRVSLRADDMSDHVTSSSMLPPGEEMIEPVIVQTTGSGTNTIYDPRNPNGYRRHSPDVAGDKQGGESPHTSSYHDNSARRKSGNQISPDSGGTTSAQAQRKKSTPSVTVNDKQVEEDDGFPWNPPRRASHASNVSVNMDATSVTMHDWRPESRSSADESKTKKKRFVCWRRFMKILRDNRVRTEAAKQHLDLLDQMQDTHFRKCKKVLNVIFLSTGFCLLMAVIVLIVYTDPQFEESMKALTTFLAGRRTGLW